MAADSTIISDKLQNSSVSCEIILPAITMMNSSYAKRDVNNDFREVIAYSGVGDKHDQHELNEDKNDFKR